MILNHSCHSLFASLPPSVSNRLQPYPSPSLPPLISPLSSLALLPLSPLPLFSLNHLNPPTAASQPQPRPRLSGGLCFWSPPGPAIQQRIFPRRCGRPQGCLRVTLLTRPAH